MKRKRVGSGADGRRMDITARTVIGNGLVTMVAGARRIKMERRNESNERTAPAAIAAQIETRSVKRAGTVTDNYFCCTVSGAMFSVDKMSRAFLYRYPVWNAGIHR
jgi:hypothetical protein